PRRALPEPARDRRLPPAPARVIPLLALALGCAATAPPGAEGDLQPARLATTDGGTWRVAWYAFPLDPGSGITSTLYLHVNRVGTAEADPTVDLAVTVEHTPSGTFADPAPTVDLTDPTAPLAH